MAKFEEENVLSDIALIGSLNPARWMAVNPGLNSEERDFELSLYLERELNIRPTEWFHFGPNLGFLLGRNFEIATGIHVGFGF